MKSKAIKLRRQKKLQREAGGLMAGVSGWSHYWRAKIHQQDGEKLEGWGDVYRMAHNLEHTARECRTIAARAMIDGD
jgi:hypothetical protein